MTLETKHCDFECNKTGEPLIAFANPNGHAWVCHASCLREQLKAQELIDEECPPLLVDAVNIDGQIHSVRACRLADFTTHCGANATRKQLMVTKQPVDKLTCPVCRGEWGLE